MKKHAKAKTKADLKAALEKAEAIYKNGILKIQSECTHEWKQFSDAITTKYKCTKCEKWKD